MDVKEYISSGILESYALGLVSPQEKQEVECMSHIYSEIKTELDKIMADMEGLAQAQKIDPPAALKQKLFSELKSIIAEGKKIGVPVPEPEVKVIPMSPGKEGGSIFKLLAAACFAGVIISGVLLFNARSATHEINSRLAEAKAANENLRKEKNAMIEALEKENAYSQKELAMFRNPDFKTVFLKNTPDKPENSLAIVCWNTKSKEVMVAVENLPIPQPEKQYQLWAIVDGKPIDMGMISQGATQKNFQVLKSVDEPEAFAITLEKSGGSPVPTIENMYVIGAI